MIERNQYIWIGLMVCLSTFACDDGSDEKSAEPCLAQCAPSSLFSCSIDNDCETGNRCHSGQYGGYCVETDLSNEQADADQRQRIEASMCFSECKNTGAGTADAQVSSPDVGCPECPAMCPPEADIPTGFICIPAGEFWMGSPEDQVPRDANNEERHLVRITDAFLIGIHEVSQSDWTSLIGNNPSFFSEDGGGCELEPCEDRPVERVNWHEAIAYANARSEAEALRPCYNLTDCDGELGAGCGAERRDCLAGYTCQGVERISACTGYRLPTEAEWEYAARGGLPDYRYGPIDDIAWYVGTARGRTRPAGGREPNPWGLYDVYGNVLEWTGDYFNQDYGFFGQPDDAIDDPNGGDFGDTRAIKGGSWRDGYEWCRAAFRTSNFPAKRADNLGFRLIRQLK